MGPSQCGFPLHTHATKLRRMPRMAAPPSPHQQQSCGHSFGHRGTPILFISITHVAQHLPLWTMTDLPGATQDVVNDIREVQLHSNSVWGAPMGGHPQIQTINSIGWHVSQVHSAHVGYALPTALVDYGIDIIGAQPSQIRSCATNAC